MITSEEIPENWELKPLGEVAEINPSVETPERENYTYVPMDAVEEETQKIDYFDTREDTYSSLAKFEEGDILLARITPCFENGKVALVDHIEDDTFAVGSSEFAVIRATKISKKYLYNYLRSSLVRQWGEKRLVGATGRERVKVSQIRNELPVPVPPTKEKQEEVAKILEDNLEKINDLERITRRLETLTEEYEDSLLAFILSGKKDMSEGAVGGIPTEDVVPDDWRLEDFGDVVDVNPRISKPETDTFAHVPMDGVSAETQSIDYFSERDSVYSGLAKFMEADILFARITPCMENGKVAIVEELPEGRDMSFGSTELAVFRTKEDVSTEYVFNYVKSQFIREVAEDQMKGATGRERVPLDFFKKELKIPIPPEGQEDEVLEKLRNIRENVNKANHSIKMVDELFDEYRDSVLAHAFKGELLDIETENESANPNKNQNEGSRPEFDTDGQQSLEQIAGGKE